MEASTLREPSQSPLSFLAPGMLEREVADLPPLSSVLGLVAHSAVVLPVLLALSVLLSVSDASSLDQGP